MVATQLVGERSGCQDSSERIERLLIMQGTVQDRIVCHLTRMGIGKIQGATEFAAHPAQKPDEWLTLDDIVGRQGCDPQPIATRSGKRSLRELIARHGKEFHASVGHPYGSPPRN